MEDIKPSKPYRGCLRGRDQLEFWMNCLEIAPQVQDAVIKIRKIREMIFSRELRLFTLEEIHLPKVEDDLLQHVALRFEPKSPASIAYVRPKKVIDLIRGRTVHIPG